MMNTYIRAKIDSDTKIKAMKTLKTLGISISDYIRMAVIQLANKKAIPFDVEVPRLPNELTRKTIEQSERGEGLHVAKDAKDLFKKLGI